MGVHGLSSFLQENRHSLAETITIVHGEQKNAHTFIVDAWSFIYGVYLESREAWAHGGEYSNFDLHINRVVKAWLGLGIQCIFVFDGAIPVIKHIEVVKRQETSRIVPANIFFRTSAQRRNEPSFLRENRIIPPLVYLACVSALKRLANSGDTEGFSAVNLVWADGEADTKCVELAGELGGYVLGRDSDFVVLNREGYKGYISLDEVLWEVKQETDDDWLVLGESTASPTISDGVEASFAETEGDDGWVPAIKPKSRAKAVLNTRKKGQLTFKGLLPPPHENIQSLSFTIYRPSKLAAHLKIPIRFLPLLGSLVGNDFTPDAYMTKFFERGARPADRVARVANVLYELLQPPGKVGKRQKIADRARKNMREGGGVGSIIAGAIQMLARWEIPSGEVEEMIEVIIEALLQYGSETDPAGPISSAVQPLSSSHCTLDGTRYYLPHPFFATPTGSQHLEDVIHLYTHAYRAGKLAPRILDVITNGTYWSNVFLEDPDIESCGRTIQEEIAGWVAAILADGLPIGVIGDKPPVDKSADSLTGGDEDEDEDELIDVIEENSESEAEGIERDERGRQRYAAVIPDYEDDGDDGGHFALDANGYPVATFTQALKRLRHEQKLSAHGRNSPSIHSPLTPCSTSDTPMIHHTMLSSGVDIGGNSGPEPTFITTYFRRGTRFTATLLTVPSLSTLLNPSNTPTSLTPPHWAPLDLRQSLEKTWSGPVQLQSHEIRLAVFLNALISNTPSIRGLTNDWAALCVALRWAILKLGLKGGAGRWRRSEAKAFLVACILGKKTAQQVDEDPPTPSVTSSLQLSASSSFLMPSPTHSLNIDKLQQTPVPAPIVEITPRSVQLTAQILASLEGVHHLSTVLLLADRIHVEQATRAFSGKTFHTLLAQVHSGEENKMMTDSLIEKDGAELFECLWSAVQEDIREEWWAEDWTTGTSSKKARKKERKAANNSTYDSVKVSVTRKAGSGMFGALAQLADN